MEYNFREIEKKWQQQWRETNAYKVSNDSRKPKFYVLDMFPYPSGAGLHVGHPLGYIASDIYARFKKLKGYNVLHPMGFDSFGLPAEQYAIETGQHPAVTSEKNIARYREQLDNIGFCYDWSREVRTSDPGYYKWTQWIFLQLFDSFYNRKTQKAERIKELIKSFEAEGNDSHQCPGDRNVKFTAQEWKSLNEARQQEIFMGYRIAYSAHGEVNWCEALGTVLANDEVVNGVSERGGHPVEKKKMRQWYLRITEYADRLLQGLEHVDFSEAMKEMQRNWIGKSEGSEIRFKLAAHNDLTPNPSPKERGTKEDNLTSSNNNPPGYMTNTFEQWKATTDFSRANRKNPTEAEEILWRELRNRKLNGYKFRRQHPVAGYIPDFICLEKNLVIEIDGGYHEEEDQQRFDIARTKWMEEHGYRLLRFTNDEVINNIAIVLQKLQKALSFGEGLGEVTPPSPLERGQGGEVITVYTTRPDTIFGVDFMVLAPEHDLVQKIVSDEQKPEIDKYLEYVKSRSERERLAEVKSITGAFTGAYALNPFDDREIPIWISEYVLAGYGTGAIMAVPCGDQRDHAFAKHFNIPITNIIGDAYNGEEANATKDAILQNSGFLDGMLMRDAINVVIDKLEEMGIGKRQINYRMRDAGFSRQRYWGEPFPIIYKNGIAYPLDESELPLELPYLENYGPGPEGEGPLANIPEWVNLHLFL
jgi:leucyl-tRNA synthetase